MPLFYQKRITREDLKANPGVFYVFGDNVERRGMRGQAAAMRGEPNAIGVATKWKPSLAPDAFFRDNQRQQIEAIWNDDLSRVVDALENRKVVIWPADGIGTGLSKLPETAPEIWAALEDFRTTFLESL